MSDELRKEKIKSVFDFSGRYFIYILLNHCFMLIEI